MNDQLISKVKKSPFGKGSARVSEGEGFKIPRLTATPFFKGGLKILVMLIIITYLAPNVVLALDYVPLAPLPVGPGGASLTRVTDAGVYIKGAFNLAIGIAAALAIIMIILGGIQYMGSESLGGKSRGKKWITDAVLGLLLALGSYVLLLTINPSLVNFNVNIGAITPPANSTPTPPADTANWSLIYTVVVSSQSGTSCYPLGSKFVCAITNSPTTKQECELRLLGMNRNKLPEGTQPTQDSPLGTIVTANCNQNP